MSSHEIKVCPDFWKDVKKIHGKCSSKELVEPKTSSGEEEYLSDGDKISSYDLLDAITTFIQSGLPANFSQIGAEHYHKQPFLQQGFQIKKMRYAFDGRGQSSGLRILFACSDTYLVLALISFKEDCKDERALETKLLGRLKDYLT